MFTGTVERALGRKRQAAEDRREVDDVALLLLLRERGREGSGKELNMIFRYFTQPS
jgi:hypothetical protein